MPRRCADSTGESLGHEPLLATLASACGPHTVALLAYRDRGWAGSEFRRACVAHGLEATVLPPGLVVAHAAEREEDPDRQLFPRVELLALCRGAAVHTTERREEEKSPLMAAG